MRLGGRLAAAIDVLQDMEGRHRPAADALKDWGLSHRFAGSGDRAAIGNIVYDALRRRLSAQWLLDGASPRAAAFGALFLEWGLDPDQLGAALDGDRFAPPPLTEAERGSVLRRRQEQPPVEVRADLPSWCTAHFQAVFGDNWVDEAEALARRPPLDIRVNTLRSTREKVLAELEGMGARAGRLAPDAIRLPPVEGSGRHPNVQVEPAFRKGWFEVQDEGSQLAALMTGASAGMQVLDYCAGAGGKTLAMAALMQNRGQIFVHDSDKGRLAPIFDRLRRAEVRNVQTATKPAELDALEGRMDLVLIDAPCTGSGTWRRKPDAKWRLTERQLEARTGEQAAILDAASRYVVPGGRLVYVTCSVFAAENGDQVSAFLGRSPHFGLRRPATDLDASSPLVACADPSGNGLLMSPRRTDTDGFFVAVLERKA